MVDYNIMTLEVAALSVIALFAILVLFSLKRMKEKQNALIELVVANIAMNRYSPKAKQEDDEDIHTENFIKFLSDSREWAFGYIENSMDVVKEVIDYAKSQLAASGDQGYQPIIDKLESLINDESAPEQP